MSASWEARFWSKVDRRTEGCWVWQGFTVRGYGRFAIGQRNLLAHRAAWILSHGSVPPDRLVCHRCDNPPCVRPDHLFLGTHADNNRDRVRKGRSRTVGRPGEKNPLAKLTAAAVKEIRVAHAAGGVRYIDLAERYGVAPGTIASVVQRKNWAHV